MQGALDADGRPIAAWHALRRGGYTCPACGEQVILKAGPVVVAHFAHRPGADCALSRGESRRHMEMKEQVGRILQHLGCDFRLEVPTGLRRADLVAGDVAIECQESPIRPAETEARTRDHNAAGYAVLWVWDLQRLCLGECIPRFADLQVGQEHRVAVEVRQWHRESFGRVYVLDDVGALMACHLEPAPARLTDGGPDGEWCDYTPKTRRCLSLHPCGRRLRTFTSAQGRWSLAGFNERVWWPAPGAPAPQSGYVILVKRGGAYTIECAREPSLRSLPGNVWPAAAAVAIHFMPAQDMVGARNRLRRRFAARRVGATGMFRLTPEDVAAICTLRDL